MMALHVSGFATLLGTPDDADRPLRRVCGRSPPSHELALSADSGRSLSPLS